MTKDIGKKLLKYTNHRTNIPQITEQIFHKSPKIAKKVLVVRNIYINSYATIRKDMLANDASTLDEDTVADYIKA